jgi:tetratricopeptide (TPR) repeat protein/DNA-binding CsgD family transcriptional regulator
MRILTFICCVLTALGATAQDRVLLDSLETALAHSKKDSSRVAIQLELSNVYFKTNFRRSLEYAHSANDLASEIGSTKHLAKSYRWMAAAYFGMSDYTNAAKGYFNALRQYELDRDTMGILAMNINLGAVHDRLYDFDQALKFFLKAQDMILENPSRPLPTTEALPSLYNNIGNIYQTKHEPQNALSYYEKALDLAQQQNSPWLTGVALNNLGKLYLNDLHDPEKAIFYLRQGLEVRRNEGDKSELSKSYLLIADYYLKEKKLPEARESAEMSLRLGEEMASLALQKFATEMLSKIEEAAGRKGEALEIFKQYKILSDSIHSQNAASEITRLQLQYDFEKAEEAREREKNETRLRYTLIIIVLSTGLVVSVLIVMIIRTRARQLELKRQNLAQDMEIKNKELTTNVLYLVRKNELINSVAERLLTLQNSFPKENQKIVHDIIFDLQKEADSDAWKEFELRFNQVHSDFYLKLRTLYPGLSPAEEKLCAFLRLNMSSKEIAAITQQSVKSVEVARARLRKKLHLTNTHSNLVTHLSSI